MSQKQSNSNNTVSTSSANIDVVIVFQSDTNTSENSEISVSFDSALPCFSKFILQQNRVTLIEFALVWERYEVSDRAGAAIASATLKALKLLPKRIKDMWRIELSCEEKDKNTEKKLETRSKNYLN